VNAVDLPLGADVGGGARPTPAMTPALPSTSSPGLPSAPPASAATLSLAELERRHIGEVLERCAWHQGHAAELLGISPKTLYRKIREYGFRRPPGRGEKA